jgi:putative transposase
MEIRFSGHGAYRTQYHIVWIPKYRRRILRPGVATFLERVLQNILSSMPDVEILEKNIQLDHVHLVVIIPPKYRVSDVVGRLKGRSSSVLRRKFQWLEKVYWEDNIVWSPGYFVSTVGIDEAVILRYVKYQQNQDTGQAKLDL